jgi:hypothetical protein
MTDPTIPADDADDRTVADGTTADDGIGSGERTDAERQAELAPEEALLDGWLPDAEPTEGTAPAP